MDSDRSLAGVLHLGAARWLMAMVLCGSTSMLLAQTKAGNPPTHAGDSTVVKPATSQEDDGWPDLSSFIDEPYGFLPMAEPITEPALGYGIWGGPTFIGQPVGETKAGFGRPNITFAGGAWTEGGTWAGMFWDQHNFLDDKLQTTAFLFYSHVGLKFHGIGDNGFLKDNPIDYDLDPIGGTLRAKYRLGESCFWAGLGYAYAKVTSVFYIPPQFPNVEDIRRDSHVGGILLFTSYDTRDNIFTPLAGTDVEIEGQLYGKALGSDAQFQRLNMTVMQFYSPLRILTFGLKVDGFLTFGAVPFYMAPSVSTRGAAAMRYQGEQVADGELEIRWQCWKRFSLVGFGGYGVAWTNLEHFENPIKVLTGGAGLRYELARKYGVHAGLDAAYSTDGWAFYVVFGSAWTWG